ncbi:hypothetical protein GWI33_001488 [Rhynchophorus ferrugineus]|uniref:Cytochrome P450 n=1 Tax=Rhynchophorus ferrugineus TaxID=354439 RepID=A0A834ILD9_RHYFE|nr:hypothetical protein GWI33_001488 [Rhynchophorus ferrugineus]
MATKQMLRHGFVCQCRSYGSTQILRKAASQPIAINDVNSKDAYYKKMGQKVDVDERPEGWDQAKPFSSIPGPKPLPILGNVWRFFPGIGEYHNIELVNWYKGMKEKYGDIVYFSGIPGKKPSVLCFNPDDTETIFRNEGTWPIRYGLNSYIYYQQKMRHDVFQGIGGVLSTQGEKWFENRSVVNKILMQPRTVDLYVDNPDNMMPNDFQNEIFKWTMESMALITYNKRIGVLNRNLQKDSQEQRFINSVLSLFDLSYKLDILPSLWPYISTPNWRKFVKAMDFLTELNQKYIQECLDSSDPSIPDHDKSVLEKLIEKDRRIAITMVNDMMIAGIDTTGKTIAAVLYYLAKNPGKQEKLRQELKTYLPEKSSPVNKDLTRASPYLKAVIKEAMRLSPIAIGILRTSVKDMVLNGYQIPKGTEVISINILPSRDDKYFMDANEFIPERWLRSTTDEYSSKNVHPFASFPFGLGPRSCVGKRLANMELQVGVAKIIRNFQFSWPHPDAQFGATLLYGIQTPLRFKVVEADE